MKTDIKRIWKRLYFSTPPEPIVFSIVEDPTTRGCTPRFDYDPVPLLRDARQAAFEQAYEDLWNTTFASDEWCGSRQRAIADTERLQRKAKKGQKGKKGKP